MAQLYWNEFTAAEWGDFTQEEWNTFLGVFVPLGQVVMAQGVYLPGVSIGSVFAAGISIGGVAS